MSMRQVSFPDYLVLVHKMLTAKRKEGQNDGRTEGRIEREW